MKDQLASKQIKQVTKVFKQFFDYPSMGLFGVYVDGLLKLD